MKRLQILTRALSGLTQELNQIARSQPTLLATAILAALGMTLWTLSYTTSTGVEIGVWVITLWATHLSDLPSDRIPKSGRLAISLIQHRQAAFRSVPAFAIAWLAYRDSQWIVSHASVLESLIGTIAGASLLYVCSFRLTAILFNRIAERLENTEWQALFTYYPTEADNNAAFAEETKQKVGAKKLAKIQRAVDDKMSGRRKGF